jgi:L-amino acid N-acyltransferase YncA
MEHVRVRPATADDWPQMWPIFLAVVADGDSYVFAPDTPESDARAYWFGPGVASFVAESNGRVAGMYKLVATMNEALARAKGLGEVLGRHALDEARGRGFRAMQFNFVVSSNSTAVRLWQKLGFAIAGVLPGAFRHSRLGFVDVYVMFRSL